MLVIQCDKELHQEPFLGCTFGRERRSVSFTENLLLENASWSVDTKMVNKLSARHADNRQHADLGNIYADLLCVLSLLIPYEEFDLSFSLLSVLRSVQSANLHTRVNLHTALLQNLAGRP